VLFLVKLFGNGEKKAARQAEKKSAKAAKSKKRSK
jgi:hypothetical protein